MDGFILTECTISLLILAYIWFYPLNQLRKDNFRSDIRRIRDELFDFMCEHGYDFNIEAYIQIRQTLNGVLRFSNNLSIPMFFISAIFFRGQMQHDELSEHIENVNDENLKRKLKEVIHNTVKRILRFLFFERSAKLFVFMIYCFLRLVKRFSDLKKWGIKTGEKLLHEAYPLGSPKLSEDQKAYLQLQ